MTYKEESFVLDTLKELKELIRSPTFNNLVRETHENNIMLRQIIKFGLLLRIDKIDNVAGLTYPDCAILLANNTYIHDGNLFLISDNEQGRYAHIRVIGSNYIGTNFSASYYGANISILSNEILS